MASRSARSEVDMGIEPNRPHWASRSVGAGEAGQAAGDNGRRHGDVTAAVQVPDFLAVGEVVGAGLVPAVDQNLGSITRLCHRRSVPSGNVVPGGVPYFTAVGQIKFGNERIPQHIAQHHHFAVMNHRRALSSLRTA